MARKLIVINKTIWQTRHLRRFVLEVARRVLDNDSKPYLVACFEPVPARGWARRSGGVSGRAPLGGSRITIRVSSVIDKTDLALVIAHEIGHLLGYEHRDMTRGAIWNRVGDWRERYAWAEALPLEPRPVKTKVRLTGLALAEKKLAHAQTKVAEHDQVIKRGQTLRRKWATKVRYYERRALALKAKTS